MEKEIFIKCLCGGCAISAEFDIEFSHEVDVALWHHGIDFTRKYSFLKRLKLAWMLISKGTLYKDCVCLGYNEVKEFNKFLENSIKEFDKEAEKILDK